jgi:hypothetical protein
MRNKKKPIVKHTSIHVALDQFEDCFLDPEHEKHEQSIALMQYAIRESVQGNPCTFWVLEAILKKKPTLDQWCILLNTEDTAWMFHRPESHCKEVVQCINDSFSAAFKEAPLDALQQVSSEEQHCLTWLLYIKKYGYDTTVYQDKIKDILDNSDSTVASDDLQWFAAMVLNVDVPETYKQKQLDTILETFNLTYAPSKKKATNLMLDKFIKDDHHYRHNYWMDMFAQYHLVFKTLILADDHNSALKDAISVRKDQWSEWVVQLCRPKSFEHSNVEHIEIALRAVDALALENNENTLVTNMLRQWVGATSFSLYRKHLEIYKSIYPEVNYNHVARNALVQPIGTLVELPAMLQ